MERKNRRQVPDLKKTMLDSGASFSFFQVIRILHKMNLKNNSDVKGAAKTREGYFKKIRIKPNLSMAFPVAAIQKIAENEHSYEITANFLALYGTLSPLPAYYTEDLFDEDMLDESFIRDFLDIINQRLYELCFLSWSKYRSMIQLYEMHNKHHEERLFCIGGFGNEKVREKINDPFRLLRYTGLFAMPTRSAAGLETLLTDATGYGARITQCMKKRSRIPRIQRFYLGQKNATLNVDGYLGREIPDSLSEFKITFGPLSDGTFRKFLPGTKLYELIMELIRLYLADAFAFTIELLVKGSHIRPSVLNGPRKKWGTLGLDTWLFSTRRIETSAIVFRG